MRRAVGDVSEISVDELPEICRRLIAEQACPLCREIVGEASVVDEGDCETSCVAAKLAVASSLLLGCTATEERVSANQSSRPANPFEVGQPFPALALPALEDGSPRSIADFRGKKLILHVFASW